jgi:ABC-type multidrug transport system fused ATPase/permease subunit
MTLGPETASALATAAIIILALFAALAALHGFMGTAVTLAVAVLLLSMAVDPADPLALAESTWQSIQPALADLRRQAVALAERAMTELLALLEATP